MTPGREWIQLVPEILEAHSRAAVDDHQDIAPRADQAVEEPDAAAGIDVAFGAFSLGGERRLKRKPRRAAEEPGRRVDIASRTSLGT